MFQSTYALHSAALSAGPVPITTAGVRIGRTPDCQIVLADDAVSRHHASLRLGIDGVLVTDENSTNGVFIDDHRISPGGPVPLHVGQVLRTGATTFTLVSMPRPVAVEVPPSVSNTAPRSNDAFWLWSVGGVLIGAVVLLLMIVAASSARATQPALKLSPMATLPATTVQGLTTATPVAVKASPTSMPAPSGGGLPVATVGPSFSAEIGAARATLNDYGGQIDMADNDPAKLNCTAIVAHYNQLQAARNRPLNPPPDAQDQVNAYFNALDVFLGKARDLTDACRSVVGGVTDRSIIVSQQVKLARAAVGDALHIIEPIMANPRF